MPWSVIAIAAFEALGSARRSEPTLINAMHRSNCGVPMKNSLLIHPEKKSSSIPNFSVCARKRTPRDHGLRDRTDTPWKSNDLLFKTVVGDEAMAIYPPDKEHIQRQRLLCKNEHSNGPRGAFNVRTAVHKRCWIEPAPRAIPFIWFLQNEDGGNNPAIQLLLYDLLKTEPRRSTPPDERHIQRFH